MRKFSPVAVKARPAVGVTFLGDSKALKCSWSISFSSWDAVRMAHLLRGSMREGCLSLRIEVILMRF